MPLFAWRRHPVWKLLGRPVAFAVPFALFFATMNRDGFLIFHLYYLAALVFSLFVNTAVEANRAWVLPRLLRRQGETGSPVPVIASFALASIVASLAAAVTLHFTLIPDLLGTPAAIVQILLWALLFSALFIGVINAANYQRRYVERVRADAERTAREEQEMRLAAAIQQALLPPRTRGDTWYAVAGASIPCRSIGGDFFEYFDLPDGRVGFALADVAGKGPAAAVLAAMVQGVFHSQARLGAGPATTMARVNEALAARDVEARFATLFYAVLSERGELVCSNAGHNPPFVIRRRDVVRRLEAGGLVIGPFRDARFEEESAQLEPGDVLVIYSDGVTDAESESGEQFGEERLLACLADADPESAAVVRDGVLDAVRRFAGGHPPADDVTVMAVRYLGPTSGSPPTS